MGATTSVLKVSANAHAPTSIPVPSLSRLLLLLLLVALGGFASGCRILRTTAEVPLRGLQTVTTGKKGQPAFDPLELQQQLIRFADDFSARMRTGIDHLQRGTNRLERVEALRLKLDYANDIMAVATGPNALANLVDMVVLVTLSRMTIEEHWIPHVYGESARPLLAGCEQAETEIWRIAGSILRPEQRTELHQAMADWRRSHPNLEAAGYTRDLGFMAEMEQSRQGTAQQPTSVFGLLRLDPLAGLDPATREIAQTRLLAERALYVGRSMPLILREQTELLAIGVAQMPELEQLLATSTQISASVERVSRVAEVLPGRISSERKEILDALDAQQGKLTSLVGETREALKAGESMSTSLNTTLGTFDRVMQRLRVGEPKPENLQKSNSPPFNILDYARTANEFAGAAQQLDTLLRSFNGTLESSAWDQRRAELKDLSEQAQASATKLLNHAFLLGAGLIVLALAAALLFKAAAARISARAPSSRP